MPISQVTDILGTPMQSERVGNHGVLQWCSTGMFSDDYIAVLTDGRVVLERTEYQNTTGVGICTRFFKPGGTIYWATLLRPSSPISNASATPSVAPERTPSQAVRPPSTLLRLAYPRSSSRPDDIAVIIGNSDYGRGGTDVPPVPPASNDAEAVKNYVQSALGVLEGNIIHVNNATNTQLVEVFGTSTDHRGKLFNWVKPGHSRVFVYYSGHGAPGNGGSPRLVPSDADAAQIGLSGYPLEVLYSNLAKLPAEKVTVVLESCFSGLSEAGSLVPNASPVSLSPKAPAVPEKLTVITAGAADQIASWEKDKSHGLFTKYFLLGNSGEADRKPHGNEDGRVSEAELESYLRENVAYSARRLYGREQTVQIIRGAGR